MFKIAVIISIFGMPFLGITTPPIHASEANCLAVMQAIDKEQWQDLESLIAELPEKSPARRVVAVTLLRHHLSQQDDERASTCLAWRIRPSLQMCRLEGIKLVKRLAKSGNLRALRSLLQQVEPGEAHQLGCKVRWQLERQVIKKAASDRDQRALANEIPHLMAANQAYGKTTLANMEVECALAEQSWDKVRTCLGSGDMDDRLRQDATHAFRDHILSQNEFDRNMARRIAASQRAINADDLEWFHAIMCSVKRMRHQVPLIRSLYTTPKNHPFLGRWIEKKFIPRPEPKYLDMMGDAFWERLRRHRLSIKRIAVDAELQHVTALADNEDWQTLQSVLSEPLFSDEARALGENKLIQHFEDHHHVTHLISFLAEQAQRLAHSESCDTVWPDRLGTAYNFAIDESIRQQNWANIELILALPFGDHNVYRAVQALLTHFKAAENLEDLGRVLNLILDHQPQLRDSCTRLRDLRNAAQFFVELAVSQANWQQLEIARKFRRAAPEAYEMARVILDAPTRDPK